MSAFSSMPPKEAHEPEMEVPEPESDCVDPVSRSTSPAPPVPDETFAEELLRDAHLPRDGKP
jgi:hypothetical protein